ncbi:uncharacterized protein TNCV_1983081 [Trichonephila clavipes]|nr:uncharacterized protein TNCV_1983081 [Trichonephila clavipes]
MCRPCQQPGQSSGGILTKGKVQRLDESGQQPWFSPGVSGLNPQCPEFLLTFQGSWSFGPRYSVWQFIKTVIKQGVDSSNGPKTRLPVYVETPLHPEKLTVWCALWAGGIIGPYFFKNDEGHNVTVNGDRYRAMITNLFIPELNNHDVQELWFQQDGATCHTARSTIDLLKDTFGDRLISRFEPVNWPPRSCD